MTEEEKKIIRSYELGKITKAELLDSYPVNLIEDKSYILNVLNTSFDTQNESEMEYALTLLPFDDFTNTSNYVQILNKILLADWHQRHEDIASLLTGIASPKSVTAFYEASITQYDYLSYDNAYELARKCIKGLGAINNVESINKLKDLTQYKIPEIAAYARKELDKKERDEKGRCGGI